MRTFRPLWPVSPGADRQPGAAPRFSCRSLDTQDFRVFFTGLRVFFTEATVPACRSHVEPISIVPIDRSLHLITI